MNLEQALPHRSASGVSVNVTAWLVKGVEAICAALLLVEIGLLFAGVICRYVLHYPLVWSDELASILFIWLTMFGAVLALHRGSHMRLTAVTSRLPRWAPLLGTLSTVLTAVFLVVLMQPVWEHVESESILTTAALGIQNTWRVSSLLVGLGLMLLLTLLDLAPRAATRDFAIAAVVVLALGAALWIAGPSLRAMGNYNLVIFFVLLVGLCIAAGTPIAFAFGICTVAYLVFANDAPLTIVISRMDEGMSHIILLAVPLFVVLGLLLQITGIAKAMIEFLASLLGHVKGGLSYVLLAGIYVVSGISGSKAADIAAIAPALFPEMQKRGYNSGEMGALLTASAAMSETIPPSLVLITIGSVVGVSISALFTGGAVPALVLAIVLAVVVGFKARRNAPAVSEKASKKVIAKLLLVALPALSLPIVIRVAVVEGVATATEVATVGIVYGVLIGLFVYRQFDAKRVYPILVETATLSGAILLIMGTATAMGWALSQSGFSRQLVAAMASMPGGAAGFMAISILVFIVLGSVLEGIPAIVLFGPLLFPAARALGIHDVHYAMVVILAMGLGLFAPPFGVGFFGACAIGKIDPNEAARYIWPYLAALLIGVIVVAAFPWLSIGFL
ncbi:TRAP transporter large permease subunit [Variovorax humicola]|uniref:TRAP transporter large permease subunit n=1 Tax=Variovorax humicola TaxID=1769758 RepID=A0ABU8VTS8_9BURK